MSSYVIMQNRWNDVSPISYGHQCCACGHTFGPAVRDHYLVHYILEGKGSFHKNGKTYSLGKGDMFIILPGEVTTYRADENEPWEYCWLGFRMPQLPEGLNTAYLQDPPVRHIFTFLRDHHGRPNLDGKVFSLLYEFLWLFSEDGAPDGSGENAYTSYTKAYLENTYMLRVSIEEIAHNLHINRRHLTALFRKEYGMPPQTFLTRLRMEKAKLFLEAGHSVSEAAIMSGYFDLPNFTRQYKAYYGVNPSRNKKAPQTFRF